MDTILQYENLVRSIISKYTYYGDYEDLYQVGMMGLVPQQFLLRCQGVRILHISSGNDGTCKGM